MTESSEFELTARVIQDEGQLHPHDCARLTAKVPPNPLKSSTRYTKVQNCDLEQFLIFNDISPTEREESLDEILRLMCP